MNQCIACGMPLTRPEDCAGGDLNAVSCVYCTDENGEIKSCAEIFEGGVQFFMGTTHSARDLAERLTRRNMKSLEYWQNNPCDLLNGETASDEEFQSAMSKL
jgi:hypothetical protein